MIGGGGGEGEGGGAPCAEEIVKANIAKFENNLDRFFLVANTRYSICACPSFKGTVSRDF